MASPAYRHHAKTVYASTGTSDAPDKPTGLADNDLVLLGVLLFSDGGNPLSAEKTITWPAGFTEIRSAYSNAHGGEEVQMAVAYKFITSAAGEPATYSCSWTGNVGNQSFAAAYSGVSSVALIDDSDENTGDGTTVTLPAMTAAAADTLAVAIANNWVAAALTYNDGVTRRDATTASCILGDEAVASSGAVAANTVTLGTSTGWAAVHVLLASQGAVAITGTATAAITEADVVAGGKTIIATLGGGTYVPAAGTPTYSTGTTKSTTTAPGRTGNGDLTIDFPTSYTPTAGHFAIIFLYHDQGTGSLPSGGWAQVTGSPFGSGTEKLQVFWKVLAGGESAPVSTISGSGTNVSHCANMAIYTGVGSIGAIGAASQGTGTPMTAAAINTTANNSIVVAAAGRGDNEDSGSQTFGGSSTGVVERLDGGTGSGNDSQVSMADLSVVTSGTSSGAFSSTTSATDPWVCVQIELMPSTPFNDARQAIINGLDSAQAEGTGWDAVVKAGLAVTAVVRTSDTIVTITLSAFGSYNITAQETITVTIPAAALTSGGPTAGTPTFTIDTASSSPLAEVDAALRKVTASLNAEQRYTIEADPVLRKLTASLVAYMRPDVEIDSVVRKLAASLVAQQVQPVTVTSSLAKVTASINLQQEQRVTIDSDLVKAAASLNAVMVPAATITSSLVKVASNINVEQSGLSPTLTIVSSLRGVAAALNAEQRYTLTIVSVLAKVSAALNVSTLSATIDSDLVKLAASLNAEQRYLMTVDSDLAKVSAALNAVMVPAATVTSVLSELQANINAEQNVDFPQFSINSTLRKVSASLNAEQRQEMQVVSTFVKLAGALGLSQRYDVNVVATLVKLAASLSAAQPYTLTIDSDLAKLVAALATVMPPESVLAYLLGLDEPIKRTSGLHEATLRADGEEHATIRRKGLDD